MAGTETQEAEKDINDVFDDLLFAEERLMQEGYEEGLKSTEKEENTEAYHLGYHRGAEIGAELGFYAGIIEQHVAKCLEQKIVTLGENLRDLIFKFPTTNEEDVDIIAELDQIRAKYKRFCALLKINVAYPEKDNLSF